MTGLVRNSDLVAMSSYAPLFAKGERSSGRPISFLVRQHRASTARVLHVRPYSRNRPDVVLPVTVDGTSAHCRAAGGQRGHEQGTHLAAAIPAATRAGAVCWDYGF